MVLTQCVENDGYVPAASNITCVPDLELLTEPKIDLLDLIGNTIGKLKH